MAMMSEITPWQKTGAAARFGPRNPYATCGITATSQSLTPIHFVKMRLVIAVLFMNGLHVQFPPATPA
jgi:hypothetical protein